MLAKSSDSVVFDLKESFETKIRDVGVQHATNMRSTVVNISLPVTGQRSLLKNSLKMLELLSEDTSTAAPAVRRRSLVSNDYLSSSVKILQRLHLPLGDAR